MATFDFSSTTNSDTSYTFIDQAVKAMNNIFIAFGEGSPYVPRLITSTASGQMITAQFENASITCEGNFSIDQAGFVTGGTLRSIVFLGNDLGFQGINNFRVADASIELMPQIGGTPGKQPTFQVEYFVQGNEAPLLNGNDTIIGSPISDQIGGYAGNDIFDFSRGNTNGRDVDRLTGGPGADTFIAPRSGNGEIKISDFSVADGDKIDVDGNPKKYRWQFVDAASPILNVQGGGKSDYVGYTLVKGGKAYVNVGGGSSNSPMWTKKTLNRIKLV
jgi:hypothetical protein